MKRYAKVYIHLLKMNLQKDFIYNVNALLTFVNAAVYFGTFILTLKFIYGELDQIMGYGYREMLILLLLAELWWYINVTFVRKNFQMIAEAINNANLDMILLKPYNMRLVIPFLEFDWRHILPSIGTFFVLVWAVADLTLGIDQIFLAFFFFANAIVAMYFFTAIFVALNFWVGRNYSIFELTFFMPELIHMPAKFFSPIMAKVFTFVLPVILMMNPVFDSLYGNLEWELAVKAISMTVILFVTAEILWRRGLNVYSSAN